jgi:hypothetical protein
VPSMRAQSLHTLMLLYLTKETIRSLSPRLFLSRMNLIFALSLPTQPYFGHPCTRRCSDPRTPSVEPPAFRLTLA